MNIIKLRIRFITFCVCFLIVSIMALGNQVVFAKEINDNSIGKELDNNNGTQTKSATVDDAGLILFNIESDPFCGGTHPGDTRTILCAAQIDPSLFSTAKTDYIVIAWDNDIYRYVNDSEAILSIYYLDFFGEVNSVEIEENYCYVGDGIRALPVDIMKHYWDSWKYSEVTSIYYVISFELEAIDEETQTEIYANYYHCDEEVFITGISVDLEIAEDEVDFGIDVTWDKDVQFVPIRGEMDYIWD